MARIGLTVHRSQHDDEIISFYEIAQTAWLHAVGVPTRGHIRGREIQTFRPCLDCHGRG